MEFVFLILVFAGITLWLVRRANDDRSELRRLRERTDQLGELVADLRRELSGRGSAFRAASEPAPGSWAPAAEPPPSNKTAPEQPALAPEEPAMAPPVWTVPTTVPRRAVEEPPTLTGATSGGPAKAPPSPPPLPGRSLPKLTLPEVSRRPAFNWEQFVGVRLFAWLGGLALFFAAALGLKYSFEHNLVPPEVRAAGGFLLGIGLLTGGVILRRREYAVTAQTLCATGVVILYAVTFACRSFYHFAFFGPVPTFLLMVLITTTAFVIAVRLDAQVVAVLGMLGGFLTPVMLATGEDNPLGLFGYIALLDAGLIAVVRRKRWDYLVVLAAVGTVVMQLGWYGKFFAAEKIFVAQAVFLGMPLLFVGAFVWAWRRDWLNEPVTAAAALPLLVTLGLSFVLLFTGDLASHPGRLFAVAFGADVLLLLLVALRPLLRPLESLGGAAVFLLLTLWTWGKLSGGLLYWAFGLYFGFALLHTFFPVALKRLRPDETPPAPVWSQFFPALALLLILLPILRDLTVPGLFWLVVLAVDALAVLLAALAGAVAGLVAVLILTLVVAGFWLSGSAIQEVPLGEGLVVIGVVAVFFFAAGAFLWRRLAGRGVAAGDLSVGSARPGTGLEAPLLIPSLSASLPFLLLMMVVAKFQPPNPSSVFGLGALLLALLLGLVRVARMDALLAIGLGCVALLEATWQKAAFDPQLALVPLLWEVGFYAVFLVFPFLWARDFQERRQPWAVAALAGPVQFALIYLLVREAYPNPVMGLLPAAFVVPSLLALVRLVRTVPPEAPHRLEHLAWFGGVTLFFITIIFPIQFDRQWITLAWGLEGAALCWLFRRLPHPGLPLVGVLLLAVAFVRLALNPAVLSYHERAATPIFNWFLYTYGIVAVCLFTAARLLMPSDYRLLQTRVAPLLQGLGTLLLFLLVNIEIADYFSPGSSLTFEFTGNFARDMTYTIAWALFAFGLLVIGIRRRAALVRYAGLGLLSVALLKLFLHDLARLNQLYRIGAFAAVAVIAIVASFLYQRFLASDVRNPEPDPSRDPS